MQADSGPAIEGDGTLSSDDASKGGRGGEADFEDLHTHWFPATCIPTSSFVAVNRIRALRCSDYIHRYFVFAMAALFIDLKFSILFCFTKHSLYEALLRIVSGHVLLRIRSGHVYAQKHSRRGKLTTIRKSRAAGRNNMYSISNLYVILSYS